MLYLVPDKSVAFIHVGVLLLVNLHDSYVVLQVHVNQHALHVIFIANKHALCVVLPSIPNVSDTVIL